MTKRVCDLSGPDLDRAVANAHGMMLYTPDWQPSRNWAQGGPLIEQELDSVINGGADGIWCHGPAWYKCQLKKHGYVAEGRTILESAMRCYVASRLGDEIGEQQ